MFSWIKRAVAGWVNKSPGDDYWFESRGISTNSGVDVTEDIAMRFATVFACVSKLSKTMATLPIHVFDRVSERERKPVDHPLNRILTYMATPDSTGLTLRETMMANVLLWGNAYAEVVWSRDGTTIEQMIALPSRDITPRRTDTGELFFEQRMPAGGKRRLPANRVLHVPGLSLNGLTGLSVIDYNRETLGLGIAAAEMSGSFYRSGFSGGFIQRDTDKVAGKLSPDGGQRVIDDIRKQIGGSGKAFGLALLRENMTYQGIDLSLKDAELLATRRFQRVDICGMFDVPLSKIHDLMDGIHDNVEQQDISWAKDSLAPWCIRFEMAIRKQLLPPDSNLYVKHNLAGLMRGDFTSQMTAFASGRQWGIFSINDVRQMLDLNPIANGDGYLEPLNMVPVGEPRIQVTSPAPVDDRSRDTESSTNESAGLVASLRPLILDAAKRIATKETKAVNNALGRLSSSGDTEKFNTWLDKFYTEHIGFVESCLSPIAEVFEQLLGRPWTSSPREVADKYAEINHDTLAAVAEDPVKMAGILDVWQREKAYSIVAGILKLGSDSVEGIDPIDDPKQFALTHEERENV